MVTTISQSKMTIKIPRATARDGVVVLPLKEYRDLQARAVPTYYLTGKKAKELDKLVEDSLREYRAGKTIKASSLKEAIQIYERQQKRQRRI